MVGDGNQPNNRVGFIYPLQGFLIKGGMTITILYITTFNHLVFCWNMCEINQLPCWIAKKGTWKLWWELTVKQKILPILHGENKIKTFRVSCWCLSQMVPKPSAGFGGLIRGWYHETGEGSQGIDAFHLNGNTKKSLTRVFQNFQMTKQQDSHLLQGFDLRSLFDAAFVCVLIF